MTVVVQDEAAAAVALPDSSMPQIVTASASETGLSSAAGTDARPTLSLEDGSVALLPIAGREYVPMPSLEVAVHTVSLHLEDHNTRFHASSLPLVLFEQAVRHIARLVRLFTHRPPPSLQVEMGGGGDRHMDVGYDGAHALLLGVGGTGRQSLVQLACHISDAALFCVRRVKGTSADEWRDVVRACLLKAGLEKCPCVLSVVDAEASPLSLWDDVASVMKTGGVGNLFSADDLVVITDAYRTSCERLSLPPTAWNALLLVGVVLRRSCVLSAPLSCSRAWCA